MNVGITGHRHLPQSARAAIEARLDERLGRCGRFVGISSLASGADQLFALRVLAGGNPVDVVLPAHDYESTFADESDRAAFRSILQRARRVETLPFRTSSDAAFLAAGKRIVDLSDELIAVWDGLPARGVGGTADVVRYAVSKPIPVTVIWPEGGER